VKPTLALDLSKSSTGWAMWDGESDTARYGSVKLGSEYTDHGNVCARVHVEMSHLYKLLQFEAVFIERPLDPVMMAKINNFDTPFLLYGLATHAFSFCAAKRIKTFHMVHQATWRKHYIGSMKIGTRKADLKALAVQRSRELGFKPRNDDEADALGILDYAIALDGVVPPWRQEHVLTQQLVASR